MIAEFLLTFQVNRKRNATGRRRLNSSNQAANDTTNPFGYKLDESTENNKVLRFFSGKETILIQLLTVPFKPLLPLRCCLRSDKLVN